MSGAGTVRYLKAFSCPAHSTRGSLELSKETEINTPELTLGCPLATMGTQTPLHGAAVHADVPSWGSGTP